MPTLPVKVTWLYKSQEEFLETSYWYRADDVIIEADLSQRLCVDLANFLVSKADNWENILADDAAIYAVTVSSPNIFDVGPARYGVPLKVPGIFGENALSDLITLRMYQLGLDSSNKPIKNGNILSGLPKSAVNCNLIDPDYRTAALAVMAQVMPLTISLSTAPVELAIRHEPAGESPVWFPAQSVDVSGIVGTDVTRRGNRSQARGEIVTAP